MSTLLEELKKYIGKESEPIIYAIDEGAIKFFAESIMDSDPLYRDKDYARTTKYKGIIGPPTFYGGATCLRNIRAGDPRTVSAVTVPMPPGWVGLNGGDDFEFFEPVKPGDILTWREKVADVYERRGRSGNLIFIIKEKTFTNQDGKVALIRRSISVLREPQKEERK